MSTSPSTTPRLRSIYLLPLILFVLLGASLRWTNLDTVQSRSLDEQSYTEGANALLDHGTAGLATLRERVRGDEMSAYNPIRLGYLYLLATTMRLTGSRDITTGAGLSCLASIASLVLLALLAWRRLSPPAALVATLLYAVSPLALMTSRRTWEESLVELLALAMIFIAAEITAGANHPAWFATLSLIGMYSIAVKQTAGLAFLLCAVWILTVLLLRGERRQSALFAAITAFAGIMALGLLSHLLGGFGTVLELSSMNSLDRNQYSIAYEGGGSWQLLHGLWLMSAVTITLAFVSLPFAFDLRRPLSAIRQTACALVLFSAAYIAPAMLLPHHLNLRYIAAAYAPLYLLASIGAGFLFHLIHRSGSKEASLLVGIGAAIVLVMACVDYHHFTAHLVAPSVRDLSIRTVLEAFGEIPSP